MGLRAPLNTYLIPVSSFRGHGVPSDGTALLRALRGSGAGCKKGGTCAPPFRLAGCPMPGQAARAFIALSAVISFGAISAVRKRKDEMCHLLSSQRFSSSSPALRRVYSTQSVRMNAIWR